MKVFMNNRLYVNKGDIRFIMNHYYDLGEPDNIFYTLATSNELGSKNQKLNDNTVFMEVEFSDDTDLDFMPIYDQNCIDFINEQPYIIDYDIFKDIPIENMEVLISRYEKEVMDILDLYTSLNNIDRMANPDLLFKIDMYRHAINDLNNLIEFRKGKGRMILPEEYTQEEMKHREFLNKMLYFTMDEYKNTDIYHY